MFTFLTADNRLAAGLRAVYRMKARPGTGALPVYTGQGAILCACQADAPRAAGAVGFLCGVCPPSGGDFFVYLTMGPGGPYLAWSVSGGGPVRYPDLLFRHPFGEGALRDEAACAVYTAASLFYPAHRIIFPVLRGCGAELELTGFTDWLGSLPVDPPVANRIPDLSGLPLTAYQKNVIEKLARGYLARQGNLPDFPAPPPPALGKYERNRWYERLCDLLNGQP